MNGHALVIKDNGERAIDAVVSILDNNPPHEWFVVIDDGSTDDTYRFVLADHKRRARLRLRRANLLLAHQVEVGRDACFEEAQERFEAAYPGQDLELRRWKVQPV